MKSKKIKINGLSHQYYTWGDTTLPKLFLLHGWMDTGAGFHFLCECLKDAYFCIAPDLRGFGRSEHASSPLGYFFYEYLADLHVLFAKLAPEEAVSVIGHSMGGNILSLYAGVFTDKIKNFVNIEGFGIYDMPPDEGPERVLKWIDGMGKKSFKNYKNRLEIVERLRQSNPRLSFEKGSFLARYLSKKEGEGVVFSADPNHKLIHPYLFQLKNFSSFLKRITARCFLIAAEETEMDEWVKSGGDLMEEIRRRMDLYPPGSKKLVLKACGHMVHYEKPEELAFLIRDFLGEV